MTILYITLAAICAAVIWAALRAPKKRGYPRSGGGEIHPLYLAEYIRSRASVDEIEIRHHSLVFRVRRIFISSSANNMVAILAEADGNARYGWLVEIDAEPRRRFLSFKTQDVAWLILNLQGGIDVAEG